MAEKPAPKLAKKTSKKAPSKAAAKSRRAVEKVKREIGRPTKYDPDHHPELFRRLALLGATQERMAFCAGIGITTLERWLNEHEAVRDAIRNGGDVADAEVVNAIFVRATGRDGDPPDTSLGLRWLSIRQRHNGWVEPRDPSVVVNNTAQANAAPPKPLNVAEVIAKAEEEGRLIDAELLSARPVDGSPAKTKRRVPLPPAPKR